jgi:hypothetical protein
MQLKVIITFQVNNKVCKSKFLSLGTWNGIKINISSRDRTKEIMPWKLVEFIWRRKNKNNEWNNFVDALKNISLQYNEENIRNSTYTEM